MRFFVALFILIISSAGAFAGADGMLIRDVAQIPTLGEWGMIAMVAALGVVGFFTLRKRLASHSR